MSDSTSRDELAVIQLNDTPVRILAGIYSEPEFRELLLRVNERVGPEDAIGFRTRPDEPSVSVLTAESTLSVRDGLEVCTAPRAREISVDVNGTDVVLMGPVHSVQGIKSAAEVQGAEVPDSYVLGLVHGRRDVEDLRDDQVIFVLEQSCFIAVGNDDNAEFDVHPPVAEALAHLRQKFGSDRIWAKEDGSKGLFVKVTDLELSQAFVQTATWMGFQISGMFPAADIYPHHVRPDLARRSGAGFDPPINPGQTFPGTGEPSTMISRSAGGHHNHSYLGPELAYMKLRKVQRWLIDSA